jgi:2-oxoacid:acceptor oxidoreductase delta subunit (pyruvate/2-ketoisovalerate family)
MEEIISKTRQDMTWNKTGCWRVVTVVYDSEMCAQCDTCTIFCPDGCIERGKIDYNYCKGCGICAEECPKAAIIVVEE